MNRIVCANRARFLCHTINVRVYNLPKVFKNEGKIKAFSFKRIFIFLNSV